MKKLALSLFMLAGLAACQTSTMPEYQAGQSFEDMVYLKTEGVAVPLPEGKWEMATAAHRPGGYLGGWNEFILVKVENGVLAGLVRAWGPDRKANWGFNPASLCEDKEMISVEKRLNVSGGIQDCRSINHWEMSYGSTSSPGWREAFDYLEKKKVIVPVNMLVAGYRKANQREMLTVFYAFNPELEGFDKPKNPVWEDSDWNKKNYLLDKKKVEYINKLKSWSASWDSKVNDAFGGYLGL